MTIVNGTHTYTTAGDSSSASGWRDRLPRFRDIAHRMPLACWPHWATFPVAFFGVMTLAMMEPNAAATPALLALKSAIGVRTPEHAFHAMLVTIAVQSVIELVMAYRTQEPDFVLHPIPRALLAQIWHLIHMFCTIAAIRYVLIPLFFARLVLHGLSNMGSGSSDSNSDSNWARDAFEPAEKVWMPTDAGYSAPTDAVPGLRSW